MEKRILELLKDKKFPEIKVLLKQQNPADIAEIFDCIDKKEIPLIFRLLPKELAAEVFVDIDFDLKEYLIAAFSDNELKSVLDELFLDDTVDIIEEMPASVAKRILAQADADKRKMINQILAYPEDSAGSIMTTEYVDLDSDFTVKTAFERIRKVGTDSETIYTCYVTDSNRILKGFVTVKDLLLAPPDAVVSDIMECPLISVNTNEDKEVVADLFDKYDFLALPVVDNENRLVGIVTVDDAIDVLVEEATEDISKMAAVTPTDTPYLKTGIFETFRTRIPWLLLLMISATFTGLIIGSFESSLAGNVIYGLALTCFMPMLMDTAGNSGSQASVTIIRSLSLGDIAFKDLGRIVFKEFRVSVLCGAALGLANFIKVLLVDNLIFGKGYDLGVILVISLTLVLTVIISKLVGCTLPLIAHKCRLDPAVMASPFITTVVDAVSLMIYFKIAKLILGI